MYTETNKERINKLKIAKKENMEKLKTKEIYSKKLLIRVLTY